jgi:hypothetical protein
MKIKLISSEPEKCNRSDGNWSVWYTIDYEPGIYHTSIAFFRKKDAIEWMKNPVLPEKSGSFNY